MKSSVALPAQAVHLGTGLRTVWRLLWAVREVFVILSAYLVYMFARKIVLGDVGVEATLNAFKVLNFEMNLGIFWEMGWQSWAIAHAPWFVTAMGWVYFMTFAPIITVTAFVFYLKDRQRYYYYRNVVMISFAVALLVFIFFPLTPPRLLPSFVDTIQAFGPSQYGGREMAAFYNVYAAMPSLHFGWTALFGIVYFTTRARGLRGVLLKVAGVAYPTMTFLAITITGNHYIVDAIGGAGVLLISFLTYELLRRWGRSSSLQTMRLWAIARFSPALRGLPRLAPRTTRRATA